MAINKVVYNGGTLIDLTGDTVTADSLMQGYTAHDKTGAIIIGTATGGSEQGTVWQDGEGYVHLDDESGISLQTKSATPSETAQTITADEGYYALQEVNVGAISSSYVGSGITRRSSSDLTVSGATVTAPSGYYSASASKSVASGTAGTPTATKGTVSNHSVSITPSVTNTTGYITGGTKSGTAVSVSASELVSGTLNVTSSGTKDVTNYASASIPSGTEGTPTATKGTVSDHTISVTPSVTNTSGFITGSTKTGTAVSVSASELVSGTKSITENGTGIDVTNYASVDVSVSGGGGGGSEPKASKDINFIDYDGTIVESYTRVEWSNVSSLPSNPSHTGLTAQGWNWSISEINSFLASRPNSTVWVGQMYVTTSGDTEIDIQIRSTALLSPYLNIAINGSVTVDWGDNTSPSTVTGTSVTVRKGVQHTYSATGNYTITIHVTSGTFAFYSSNSTYTLLYKATAANPNRVYANCVRAVRVGNNASISQYAFYNCHSLTSVTIPMNTTGFSSQQSFGNCYSLCSLTLPNNVTVVPLYMCPYCTSLSSVSIPYGVTSMTNDSFEYCYSLREITIPEGVTSLGDYYFQNCNSLESVDLPNGITSIGNRAFSSCVSLASVTVPSTVTTIGTYAFGYCYGASEYHFKPTTPPTLGANAFYSIQSGCKIYVPTGSLSDYQAATNWSNYASYMEEE